MPIWDPDSDRNPDSTTENFGKDIYITKEVEQTWFMSSGHNF